jgi:hypothetical protein
MDGAWSTNRGEEECIEDIGGKARKPRDLYPLVENKLPSETNHLLFMLLSAVSCLEVRKIRSREIRVRLICVITTLLERMGSDLVMLLIGHALLHLHNVLITCLSLQTWNISFVICLNVLEDIKILKVTAWCKKTQGRDSWKAVIKEAKAHKGL